MSSTKSSPSFAGAARHIGLVPRVTLWIKHETNIYISIQNLLHFHILYIPQVYSKFAFRIYTLGHTFFALVGTSNGEVFVKAIPCIKKVIITRMFLSENSFSKLKQYNIPVFKDTLQLSLAPLLSCHTIRQFQNGLILL